MSSHSPVTTGGSISFYTSTRVQEDFGFFAVVLEIAEGLTKEIPDGLSVRFIRCSDQGCSSPLSAEIAIRGKVSFSIWSNIQYEEGLRNREVLYLGRHGSPEVEFWGDRLEGVRHIDRAEVIAAAKDLIMRTL